MWCSLNLCGLHILASAVRTLCASPGSVLTKPWQGVPNTPPPPGCGLSVVCMFSQCFKFGCISLPS